MAVKVKRLLTPEDIEHMMKCGQLSEDDFFELVNGEIVWLAPSFDPQAWTGSLMIAALTPFAKGLGGRVLDSSAGFRVGADLKQLRGPDVSLVTKERLHILRGNAFAMGAPDLAVEVLSTGQYGEAYAVSKRSEYFAAGAKVIWFADLRTRTVREYLPGSDEVRIFHAEDEITLDAIAPGFRCRVGEFFPED